MRWLLLLFSAVGCGNRPGEATVVGNPGQLTVRLAEVPGLPFDTGTLSVSDVQWQPCAEDSAEGSGPASLDLIAPEPLPVPAGRWCGLTLSVDGPVQVSGLAAAVFDLTLQTEDLFADLAPGRDVDGTSLVLELGGPEWLSADWLQLDAGDQVVDLDSPLHDVLVDRFLAGTALFFDANGDGLVDPDERAEGPLATLPPAELARRWVAVGAGKTVLSSADGLRWVVDVQGDAGDESQRLYDVTAGDGALVAVGGDLTQLSITSGDGLTWDESTTDEIRLHGVAYGDGLYVGVGQSGRRAWSTDGHIWNEALPREFTDQYTEVAYGDGRFVGVGVGGLRATTVDGETWTGEQRAGADLLGVAYGNGVFVAVGVDGRRLISTDGALWTDDALEGTKFWDVTFGDGVFVAATEAGAFESSDGISWSQTGDTALHAITWAEGAYLATGAAGTLYRSLDGATWAALDSPVSTDLHSVSFSRTLSTSPQPAP